MKKAVGIIVGSGKHDDFSHAIAVGNELGIPVIASKNVVSDIIPNNLVVTMDSKNGVVYNSGH